MAPVPDPPTPSPQDVAAYLASLRALANDPANPSGASDYLSKAGFQMQNVGLGSPSWQNNMHYDAIRQSAAPLYASNGMAGGVADIDKARTAIKQAANDVEQHFEAFDRAIAAATASMWHGQAGQAMADAIRTYVVDSYRLTEAGYAVSAQFESLYQSMSATSEKLPTQPHPYAAGLRDAVEFWDWGSDTSAQSRAETATTGQAVQVMDTVYHGADGGSGLALTAKSLPVMPAPQTPVSNHQPGDQNSPYSGPASHNGNAPGVNASGVPTTGSANNAADPNAAGNQHQPGSGTDLGKSPNDSGNNGSGKPLGSNPNGSDPNGITASAADPTGGLGAGGFGGGPGSGAGSGGLASPTLGGTGVNANPTAAVVGPGTAGTGQSGMPGMGMPGAGKGKKEEDKEHKSPNYLLGEYLKDWLYGDAKLPPSVLGAWPEEMIERSKE